MASEPVHAFGPFRLDTARRRLERDAQPVALNDRQFAILQRLVRHAGEVVNKDDLVSAAWSDVAVTDNSLAQVVSSLRRLLGPQADGRPYIETVARRGYRFAAAVTTAVARVTDEALAARLEPYRVFVEGRAAVETLERDAVAAAVEAFQRVLETDPDYAPAHVGLANANTLQFDATRFSGEPDIGALEQAVHHAREACRLDPDSGETWATLGFVLSRAGFGTDATAACRRATAIDPGNWRHQVRLAYAAWGDERLRAAHAALQRLAGLGMAHWLAASVYVAREDFEEASRELIRGAQAQDAQAVGGRFGAVGLHLLLGLVRNAQGDRVGAERALAREITFESAGHIYSAHACASAWYATGAMHLAAGEAEPAMAAFVQALERAPGHPMALAAMAAVVRGSQRAAWLERFLRCRSRLELRGAVVDAAVAESVADILSDRPARAADRILVALARESESSSAGWGIPADPLLQTWRDPNLWQGVLTTLRGRAA